MCIRDSTYSVTITDVNTYFKEFGPFTIDGPTKRVDIVSSQLIHVKCFNEPTGSIFINVNYGTPPYNFNWSNGNTTDAPDNLKAGTYTCLLYTSDAADDLHCVDLGGRRIIKKKQNYIRLDTANLIYPQDQHSFLLY